MRIFFAVLLCLPLACLAERLDKKCDAAIDVMGDLLKEREYLAGWIGSKDEKVLGGCQCIETITCGAPDNFCVAYKCPNDDKEISIFTDIQRLVAKVGMGRSPISGNEGQP